MENLKKVELLAPAGSFEALKVAIASGADAVYISGKSFGARAFAPNFTNEEIEKAVLYAHAFNKKVFITINTLVFDEEFTELSNYVDFLYNAKVDAIIVQDLGVLHLIKTKYPDFIVHASTQMSIYNKQGIENLRKLGVSRAILARETDIETVKELSKLGMEIEIFVHGALCYSYSGNCLMSFIHGGRSGNRGACAQPCRKKYSLFENNKLVVDKKSILSMKDLQTVNNIDKIIESGVTSLKVEGRMKSLEYVNNVISLYRKKIDEYYSNNFNEITKEEQKKIKVTFNREFTKGYLFKDNNIKITNFNSVNHLGIPLGKIIAINGNRISIKLTEDLNYGDGIRFKGLNESGTFVNEIYLNGKLVKNAKVNDVITIITNAPCKNGDFVFKTVDILLQNKALEIAKKFPLKRDINLDLVIKFNEPMILKIYDDEVEVTEYSNTLSEVVKNPLDEERIKSQISKFNDTIFKVNNINVEYDQKAFFTIKELNDLRRSATLKFENKLVNNLERKELLIEYSNINEINKKLEIEAVVFKKRHFELCKKQGIDNVYFKESYSDRFSTELNDSGMIHNIGQFKEKENFVPSIYMNIVNSHALKLLEKMKIKKAYLSTEVDLNIIEKMKFTNIEVGYFVYGREDIMVSNQCFIASALGYEKKKCMSCLKNSYSIIDEYGNKYPVMTDFSNCDIRILNHNIRNDINLISNLKENGISKFLLIFTNETDDEIVKVINSIKNQI